MSKITLSGNASGTGTFTLASPDSNSDRTLDLPDAGGTMVLDTATQTLTNKTIQGGALTLATAVTASGTAVDFTSIPSWVKRVTVMFDGVSTNGTSFPWLVRIGPSGGVETTGYLGSSSQITSVAAVGNNYTTGFGLAVDNSSANIVNGSLVISLLNASTNTWVASGIFGQSNRAFTVLLGYSKALAGTLSVLRITTTNGTDTFDAGTINIMYEG
jgi:hypothetical protein